MFWNFGPRVDKVNELLDKEGVTLTEILEQDSFSSSIRNTSNQRLFDFLSTQENMEELLKWALSDEYKSKPRYAKLANAAVIAFSSSKPFQQICMANQIFLDNLIEFAKSKPPSSRTCGHYQRIIESLANLTKGEILKKLTDFPDFLINNITDMALKDLFVIMATEFTESFGFNTELLIKLVSTVNNENGLFVVSAIRDILKPNNDLKSSIFDSADFIDLLFKLSIEKSKDSPLLATELLRLLKLFKGYSNFNSVLSKYENFEYEINLSLPFQIQVFGKLNEKIFDLFFDLSSCSLLVEAIYNTFFEKPKEEQIEWTKRANLKQRIVDTFLKSATNARITDLAHLIFTDFKNSPDNEYDQIFSQSFEKDVEDRISLRISEYGGRVRDDDDDDDEEDDDDGEEEDDDDDDDDDDDLQTIEFEGERLDVSDEEEKEEEEEKEPEPPKREKIVETESDGSGENEDEESKDDDKKDENGDNQQQEQQEEKNQEPQ